MKIIKELSEHIEEEIEGAEEYIKAAIKYKHEYPSLANTLYEMSLDEMHHMNLIHGEVVKLIEEHRREKGTPPAAMLAVYDYLHEKQIEEANEVKMYQSQYRDADTGKNR